MSASRSLFARELGRDALSTFQSKTSDRLISLLQPSPAGPPHHHRGVNSIAIDPLTGSSLLSAGADSSVALWDLYGANAPVASNPRTTPDPPLSINKVSYYPFDANAFLLSCVDGSVRFCETERLAPRVTFPLGNAVNSHDTSAELSVACALAAPVARLVDLRTGGSTHTLPHSRGEVLSVAWRPQRMCVLASAASDGRVRIWDTRRADAAVAELDLEVWEGREGRNYASRAKAHEGPVNGLAWTEDGRFLVTVGKDERMRVWDGGRRFVNTLVHFGPRVKDEKRGVLNPVVAPSWTGANYVAFTASGGLEVFDLMSGTSVKRLFLPKMEGRIMDIQWRTGSVEVYAAHGDGTIRMWKPEAGGDESGKKRKRDDGDEANVLEDIVRGLTEQQVTFS
ncbi:WD40 repeat-like protein [Piedraia hortae CBS 480.64]|uniref:WD40 repeat-like protein n=1 Tax=Piedraia hortae CBS 480.64 TaxID=1314780 RepID=A0A6A7BUG4_9PEZI|nr:WD40 repeat-like protein [Piedraia hortae CBS 480.64]